MRLSSPARSKWRTNSRKESNAMRGAYAAGVGAATGMERTRSSAAESRLIKLACEGRLASLRARSKRIHHETHRLSCEPLLEPTDHFPSRVARPAWPGRGLLLAGPFLPQQRGRAG